MYVDFKISKVAAFQPVICQPPASLDPPDRGQWGKSGVPRVASESCPQPMRIYDAEGKCSACSPVSGCLQMLWPTAWMLLPLLPFSPTHACSQRDAVMPSHCSDVSHVFRQDYYHSFKEASVKDIRKETVNAGLGSTWKRNCSSQIIGYSLFNAGSSLQQQVQLFAAVFSPSVTQQFTEPLRKIVNFNENTEVNQQFKFNFHSNIAASLFCLSRLLSCAIFKMLCNIKC